MRLREVLSVLNKSSPYAVSTERFESISKSLDEVKSYLYIETDIESAFKKELISISSNNKKLIFLCGSSGDGKSEILTRYSQKFATRAKFHLDATHSFRPQDNAIQTLDELFKQYDNEDKTLVIGINVGMLGNYAEEGENQAIKESIKSYLHDNANTVPSSHTFLNFEDFPKFKLETHGHTSEFAKSLFTKLTSSSDENLIRYYFDKEKTHSDKDKKLCVNYELLSKAEVQDAIIDLLFKARLVKDQFMTARSLLDFVFHLLAGPHYLFDNLFSTNDNELASKIAEFDPASIRTKRLDTFILERSLKLPDEQLDIYYKHLSELGIQRIKNNPNSLIRLFYLLKGSTESNQYPAQFKDDFTETLLGKYSELWHLHNAFSESAEDKVLLRKHYKETLVNAIRRYNNRNALNVDKDDYAISEHNGYWITASVDIKVNLVAVNQTANLNDPSHFTAAFKVNNDTKTLMISINMLELMSRIVEGYRPNKNDKNAVIQLEEFVQEVRNIARHSKALNIIKDARYKVTYSDDEMEVSGL